MRDGGTKLIEDRPDCFYRNFTFSTETSTRLNLALAPQKKGFVLTLDRTDWKLGAKPIDILMLGDCDSKAFALAKGALFPDQD
jgi:hypothetical protein